MPLSSEDEDVLHWQFENIEDGKKITNGLLFTQIWAAGAVVIWDLTRVGFWVCALLACVWLIMTIVYARDLADSEVALKAGIAEREGMGHRREEDHVIEPQTADVDCLDDDAPAFLRPTGHLDV